MPITIHLYLIAYSFVTKSIYDLLRYVLPKLLKSARFGEFKDALQFIL